MAPKDSFYFVFLILLLHGIGTLLPWNMLINAQNYFEYKLNITDPSPALENYQTNFLSYLGIASKAPNILLQIINMCANTSYGSLSLRISITLIVQSMVFVFTIVLAIVNTTGWPEIFFWITMLSAVVINIANGIYQGCVYGAAAKLPMKYTNAVTIGMNLSGTIASTFMIISIAVSPTPKVVAIIFFSCAVVILTLCLITEFYLKNNNFYVYHTEKEVESEIFYDNIKTINGMDAEDRPRPELDFKGLVLYKHVFKKIWVQLLNIIIIYFVSLSIFPALMVNIKPMDNVINEDYFVPVFCFLSFNLFATLGNFIAQWVNKPGPKYLIIFTLLRVLFIPFFIACNYRPEHIDRNMTVIIKHDWIYIVGGVLMATSSGYLASLAMMYTPRCVQQKYATTAGMMAALTIILGILLGLNFSLVYPLIMKI